MKNRFVPCRHPGKKRVNNNKLVKALCYDYSDQMAMIKLVQVQFTEFNL